MLIAALLTGTVSALDLLYPFEAFFYDLRNQVAQKPMRDDIVLLGIDDAAMKKHGGWPWDRHILADEIKKLDKAGARRIIFDSQFVDKGLGRQDPLLSAANNANAEVYFGVLPETMQYSDNFVMANDLKGRLLIPDGNRILYLGMNFDFRGVPVSAPKSAQVKINNEKKTISSLANLISLQTNHDDLLKVDLNAKYNNNIKSIANWEGKANVKGRDVVIIPNTGVFNDIFRVPFDGYLPGGVLQVMASQSISAEYKYATTYCYIIFCIIVFLYVYKSSYVSKNKLYIINTVQNIFIISIGWPLERAGYEFYYMPFVFCSIIFCLAVKYGYDKYKNSLANATDSLTGLPNGTAHVRAIEANGNEARVIVAATIGNSSDISCVLNEQKILDFYREVERRILSSNGAEVIYHAGYDSVTWDVPKAIFPDVEDYAKAMRAMMLQPFIIDGQTIRADLSYGFDLDTEISAYRRLANALNAAQRAASSHKLYSDYGLVNDNSASWRIALSSSIDQLLADGQFSLAFQPKLNLASGQVESAECLMRWTHPDYGAIPPSEFIEAAEQGSAIVDLTNFAIESALEALTRIRKIKPNFTLAVNLSPSLLDDSDFAAQVLDRIDSYGMERSALILEITEAASLADRSTAMDMLDTLANAGVPLSIDDYGTGRSTLDYLRVIPAREIKLDRSFIGDMIINEQNRNLVESTIALAQTLNLSTVAEGVENLATLSMLEAMECTYVQGYHIGWPHSLEDFTKKFVLQTNTYAA